jgi:hypothetical protein
MASKNDILTFFHQKFCRGVTLPTFPLPTGFSVITDHLSAGEVLPGCDPQCGRVSQHSINFSSLAG